MNARTRYFLVLLLLGTLASLAYGLNYMYFSEQEWTSLNEYVKWYHGDTLAGPIRSNDCIAVMSDPVFEDYVISSAHDFWRGTGFNPSYGTDATVFDAPELLLPDSASWLRAQAEEQGTFFTAPSPSLRACVRLSGVMLELWWVTMDHLPDTVETEILQLPPVAAVFFDSELYLSGSVSGELMIGASGRIGLEDNLIYSSSSIEQWGEPLPGHGEKLAVVSEGEIKVLNTTKNGRDNSGGQGLSQTDPGQTSIALNGIYVALDANFTFDNQNDLNPDSGGYISTSYPDDRGTVYLWGSLYNQRRGFMHRSTHSSTGYIKHYRYDPALKFWDLHLFDADENTADHSPQLFNVPVGTTARDTIVFRNDFVPAQAESLRFASGSPFSATAGHGSTIWEKQIVVCFSPPAEGTWRDTLRIYVPYYTQWVGVPVVGSTFDAATVDGPPVLPGSYGLTAAPNPFNAQTTLTFTLPQAGRVRLEIYDLLGRRVARLLDGTRPAGEHRLFFDASALPSGLYVARLAGPGAASTTKLALLK